MDRSIGFLVVVIGALVILAMNFQLLVRIVDDLLPQIDIVQNRALGAEKRNLCRDFFQSGFSLDSYTKGFSSQNEIIAFTDSDVQTRYVKDKLFCGSYLSLLDEIEKDGNVDSLIDKIESGYEEIYPGVDLDADRLKEAAGMEGAKRDDAIYVALIESMEGFSP